MATSVRCDKWLWAVRIFKTRAAANEACRKGRVRIGSDAAKPSSKISVGATVVVRKDGYSSTFIVEKLIEKRVGAAIAVDCYQDVTPEEDRPKPKRRSGDNRLDAAWAERDRGTGRPTKKQRRQLEKFLGRRKS